MSPRLSSLQLLGSADHRSDRGTSDRVRVEAGLSAADRFAGYPIGERAAAQGGQGSRALERLPTQVRPGAELFCLVLCLCF